MNNTSSPKLQTYGIYLPTHVVLTKGHGLAAAHQQLLSFDAALEAGKISDYNHMRVTSVFPPGAELCEIADIMMPEKGTLVPTVYSQATDIGPRTIAAALAVATPLDPSQNGMIFEITGTDREYIKDTAEQMVLKAMQRKNIAIRNITIMSDEIHVPDKMSGTIVIAALLLNKTPSTF